MSSAAAVMAGKGLPDAARYAFVILGAVADIALGALVLVRASARLACLGMIGLSLAYLAAGTWLTPGFWADPMGPFVKVVPAILLAATALALLEER